MVLPPQFDLPHTYSRVTLPSMQALLDSCACWAVVVEGIASTEDEVQRKCRAIAQLSAQLAQYVAGAACKNVWRVDEFAADTCIW